MSFTKITKELYHCKCERPNCGHDWDSEVIPLRCPKCGSRAWNRPLKIERRKPITFDGITQSVYAWSKQLGLSKTVIPWRIKQGWPMEQVMSREDWRFKEERKP